MENLTPLMKQYENIKNRYKDYIVFFRLGDFYEMFYEDAKIVSNLLGLTLTSRGEGIAMCGVPAANYEFYARKLVTEFGKKIAVCDQTETPEEAKKQNRSLVNREVVKKITKGTYVDEIDYKNNFVMVILKEEENYHLVYGDLGTGDCFSENVSKEFIHSAIFRINPSEIILKKNLEEMSLYEESIVIFNERSELEEETELNQFQKEGLEILTGYFKSNGYSFTPNFISLDSNIYMKSNSNTIKNLEILSSYIGDKKNSLVEFLDYTKTPMGKRVLRNNIMKPLAKVSIIEQKLDCVEYFVNRLASSGSIRFDVGDLNKIVNRINSAKDLRKLGENIQQALIKIKILEKLPTYLFKIEESIGYISVHEDIINNISPNCGEIGDGTVFKFSKVVQDLKKEEEEVIEQMNNLPSKYGVYCKLKHNNLIGFFLETNYKGNVPEFFMLKQGLANSSRYTTRELVNLEGKIKEIREKMEISEKALFNDFLKRIKEEKASIEKLSNFIGELDYFQSCALCALENNYYRPKFVQEKNVLEVEEGRHPIIERKTEIFIKNNTKMNKNERIFFITGPNMGGKSTYLRQNALFVLMAQCGMFVPGKMKSSVFDGLFVRMGAGDNTTEGDSTFMVEMKECTEIIKKSTESSFVVLDEVGRGTSTGDGTSICIAILEYLHDIKGCLTMISSHYNEIADKISYLNALCFKRMKVYIKDSKITFMHEIEDGISSSSFGIEVAEKSGLPQQIIERSKEILKNYKC